MTEVTGEPARTGWVIPRVLAFQQDVIKDGTVVGSVPVRWGVVLPDMRVATWPLTGVIALTIHEDLDAASFVLGAWPTPIDQRHVNWTDGDQVLISDVDSFSASAVDEGGQAR